MKKDTVSQIKDRQLIAELGNTKLSDKGTLSKQFLDHAGSFGKRTIIDISEIDLNRTNEHFRTNKFLAEAKNFLQDCGFTKSNSTFLETFPINFNNLNKPTRKKKKW